MTEVSETLEAVKGFGGYTTTVSVWLVFLIAWWKGLPALIEAWTKRQSAIEERMAKLLSDATDRFNREIAESDRRHAECMESNRLLATRLNEQDSIIAGHAKTIGAQSKQLVDQTNMIEGLKRQILSVGEGAIRLAARPPGTTGEPSEILGPALEQLGTITRGQP